MLHQHIEKNSKKKMVDRPKRKKDINATALQNL